MSEEKKDDLKQPGAGQPGKEGDVTPPEGQPSKKEGEEDIGTLKERLKKAEEDRDNYKAGLLSQKAKKVNLSPDLDDEPDPPQAAPGSQKDPYEGMDEDEVKIMKRQEQIAARQTERVLFEQNRRAIKQNEQVAISQFLKDHPETGDEGLMNMITEEYTNKHGKSVDGIRMDLERAYNLVKIDRNMPTNPAPPDVVNNIEKDLAGVPSGQGNTNAHLNATPQGFDKEALSAMAELGMEATPEKLNELREAVESGRLKLPENVLDKLFNSQ